MNIKNGSGPPNVEHSFMSALHGMQPPPPPNLLTQADLKPPPDDGLNSYNSPQLSVEVGVTSMEAYGCGYVAIDIQLLVSLKITETSCDYKMLWIFFCCHSEAMKVYFKRLN
jgi:hypothetical protein